MCLIKVSLNHRTIRNEYLITQTNVLHRLFRTEPLDNLIGYLTRQCVKYLALRFEAQWLDMKCQ